MTAAFRLWLVRHGETAGQSSIRYHGSNDVPLSDQGRAQIALLPPLLADLRPAAIVHSPLSRAVESAEILAKALAWPSQLLVADERLREISFGQCEGMTESEIAAAFPAFWEARQRGPIDAFPGGESRRAFAQRVHDGIHHALATHAHGDLVVVAHRGTVRQALRAVLGIGFEQPDPVPQFGVRLASLSVLARGSAGWQVEMLDFVP